MSTTRRRPRDRFNRFVDDNEVAWELVMAALAAAFVVVGFAGDSPLVDGVDVALTAVFVVEFTSRLAASRDRRRYLAGHWIDLVAIIPATRGLRLLRLL